MDANGAWSVEEATEAIARLTAAPLAVAAVEEPVSGGEAWVQLRAALQGAGIDVELSMDETADREPAAVNRGPDVVELKLARTGGIGTLLVQASLAQLAGVEVAIASTFDGPLGIAAAVHAAAALGIERPLGLATLEALDLTEHPISRSSQRCWSRAAGRSPSRPAPGCSSPGALLDEVVGAAQLVGEALRHPRGPRRRLPRA